MTQGKAPDPHSAPPSADGAAAVSAGSIVRAAAAGTIYCGVVFAAGFGLGAMRALVLAPAIGELAAVLVEMPLILSLSVFVAGRLIGKMRVGKTLAERLVMGASAFGLLVVVETGLAIVLTGQPPSEQLAAYGRPDKLVGLAGQILFAALPALLLVVRR